MSSEVEFNAYFEDLWHRGEFGVATNLLIDQTDNIVGGRSAIFVGRVATVLCNRWRWQEAATLYERAAAITLSGPLERHLSRQRRATRASNFRDRAARSLWIADSPNAIEDARRAAHFAIQHCSVRAQGNVLQNLANRLQAVGDLENEFRVLGLAYKNISPTLKRGRASILLRLAALHESRGSDQVESILRTISTLVEGEERVAIEVNIDACVRGERVGPRLDELRSLFDREVTREDGALFIRSVDRRDYASAVEELLIRSQWRTGLQPGENGFDDPLEERSWATWFALQIGEHDLAAQIVYDNSIECSKRVAVSVVDLAVRTLPFIADSESAVHLVERAIEHTLKQAPRSEAELAQAFLCSQIERGHLEHEVFSGIKSLISIEINNEEVAQRRGRDSQRIKTVGTRNVAPKRRVPHIGPAEARILTRLHTKLRELDAMAPHAAGRTELMEDISFAIAKYASAKLEWKESRCDHACPQYFEYVGQAVAAEWLKSGAVTFSRGWCRVATQQAKLRWLATFFNEEGRRTDLRLPASGAVVDVTDLSGDESNPDRSIHPSVARRARQLENRLPAKATQARLLREDARRSSPKATLVGVGNTSAILDEIQRLGQTNQDPSQALEIVLEAIGNVFQNSGISGWTQTRRSLEEGNIDSVLNWSTNTVHLHGESRDAVTAASAAIIIAVLSNRSRVGSLRNALEPVFGWNQPQSRPSNYLAMTSGSGNQPSRSIFEHHTKVDAHSSVPEVAAVIQFTNGAAMKTVLNNIRPIASNIDCLSVAGARFSAGLRLSS